MGRMEWLPPVDGSNRGLFVDRVLASYVTLEGYMGGAFASIACWSCSVFDATVEQSSQAVEVGLRPVSGAAAGLVEKRIRLDPTGELSARYRWDPTAFPPDAFFCPEGSLSRERGPDLTP